MSATDHDRDRGGLIRFRSVLAGQVRDRGGLLHNRVSVFCCGVQKGGTTSLGVCFRAHPALSSPAWKEIHFFDDEKRDWNIPDYAALDIFFAPDDAGRLRFDVTPIYSYWLPALARIRAYHPDARLIFLFRDPFDRAWSEWRMGYALRWKTLDFAAAIREGRDRIRMLPPLAPGRQFHS